MLTIVYKHQRQYTNIRPPAYAYRLIGLAQVVENVSPIVDIPETESQVRPLARLTLPVNRLWPGR